MQPHGKGPRSLARASDDLDYGFFVIIFLIGTAVIVAGLVISAALMTQARENQALADAIGYFRACRALNYEPSFCVEITQKVHGVTFTAGGDVVSAPSSKNVS
jgi:hypothetical protein